MASPVSDNVSALVRAGGRQAAKTLMVMGLLRSGPMHGYELHRIVVAHGSLYADFKKPTLYHLMHRLSLQGIVDVRSEGGARGRRGERLMFSLTASGERAFRGLLRKALSSYEPDQTTFEIAAAFLPCLPAKEGLGLLRKRHAHVISLRDEVVAELDHLVAAPADQRTAARSLAADHTLSLLDTELAWIGRAVRHLSTPAGRTTRLERELIAAPAFSLPTL